MEPGPDLEIALQRVREGDADAFEVVVRTWEWPLRAWLATRCPSAVEVDEVAQRAFVEAFRNIGRYQPGTDFRAWLWAIARAQLLGEATRARRQDDYRRRMLPDALRMEAERQCAAEADVVDIDGERLEALRACLGDLPERNRHLIDLRYQDDLDLAGIAEHVGRSVGALKKAFFKLRRHLVECVGRRLGGVPGHE